MGFTASIRNHCGPGIGWYSCLTAALNLVLAGDPRHYIHQISFHTSSFIHDNCSKVSQLFVG